MSRREAREKAMQLLYQLESQSEDISGQIKAFLAERTPLPEMAAAAPLSDDVDRTGKPAFVPLNNEERIYLENLVKGVLKRSEELDRIYAPYLVKWKPERLPRVERILLRMGTYEIVFCPEVPDSVAINEVILLARGYADEDSYSYINAVLGKVSRKAGAEPEEFSAKPRDGKAASDSCEDAPAEALEELSSEISEEEGKENFSDHDTPREEEQI